LSFVPDCVQFRKEMRRNPVPPVQRDRIVERRLAASAEDARSHDLT